MRLGRRLNTHSIGQAGSLSSWKLSKLCASRDGLSGGTVTRKSSRCATRVLAPLAEPNISHPSLLHIMILLGQAPLFLADAA